METRRRKRQSEAEAAEASAPVETRAQKAARLARAGSLASSAQKCEKAPSKRKRSEPTAQRTSKARPAPAAAPASKTKPDEQDGTKQQAPEEKPDVKLEPNLRAEPSQTGVEMDRRHRDSMRRQLAEGLDDEGALGDDFPKNASALQGLLRKLGGAAGAFDDFFSAGIVSTSRFKSILVLLRSEDSESQLDGLRQLNEVLSVAMEDALSMSPVDQVIPVLVNLLQESENPEILLLSARGLTYLADVMPACCGMIVRHEAVPVLCERLLNIEYIDVAEQSLTALSKLALEHAHACVRDGALIACLSYLDFFEASVQRIAVATAAQMCRGLSISHIDSINSAVPILTNLLQYQDTKVVENASLALTRIAEALQHHPQALTTLCGQGLISNTLQLVSVSETGSMTTPLEVGTYFGLIKLLTTCVTGSASVAETLLQAGASKIIHKLLSSSPLFSMPSVNSSSILRTADQLKEVISLTVALLPPLPDSATMVLEDLPVTASTLDGINEADGDIVERRKFLADNQNLLQSFNEDILPLMLIVYPGTVVTPVKVKCLQTVIKILQYTPASGLAVLLASSPISSFTASLLTNPDATILAGGLRVAELLQLKLPEIFTTSLLKEGVVHAIESLAMEAPAAPSASLEKQRPKRASSRLKGKASKKTAASAEEAAPVSAPVAPKPVGTAGLRQACAVRAQQFISKHYANSAAGLSVDTDGVRLLRNLCKDLDHPQAITQLLKALKEKNSAEVSTFEFLKSGAIGSIREYLMGEDLMPEERTERLLKRLQGFCEVSMQASNTSGLQSLIKKLQEGLSAEEQFPVFASQIVVASRYGRSSHGNRGSSAGDTNYLSQGLTALHQPFKLNLSRASHETTLADYGSNTVLIEPLATMNAVEDFLYPRIQRSAEQARNERGSNPPAEAQPSPRAAAAAKANHSADLQTARALAEAMRTDAAAPDALRWESSGGRGQGRRPASQVQPIPVPQGDDNKHGTRSRITHAASLLRRALSPRESGAEAKDKDAGLADEPEALPSGANSDEGAEMEEEDYSDEDEDMDEDMDDGMDDDDHLGMNQLQIHTVDLDEAAPSGEPDQQATRATGETPASDGAENPPPGGSATEATARPDAGRSALTTALQDGGGGGGRSYAQATAGPDSQAGDPAAGGGRAAQKARRMEAKLRFYVNDRPVPSNYTIFQAVNDLFREHREEEASPESMSGRRRRLWEETHTLYYSSADNVRAGAEDSTSVDVSYEDSTTTAAGLSELLDVSVPSQLDVSAQLRDVLLLLRLLEALNRLGGYLVRSQEGLEGIASVAQPVIPLVPREDLISHKLSPKLSQQLKDVLALCGGNLPVWIRALIVPFKFLFSFDLRRHYFYCTSSGVGRALNHLQAWQASEGVNSVIEQRAGRVQRAKVRISRRRLMESAVKVMDMYAGSQSVLELEYFGEAGTGLGPTLEFYTMISHEIQRKGMNMWRGDHGEEIVDQAVSVEVTKPADGVMMQLGPAMPDKHASKRQQYLSAPQGLFPAPIQPSKIHDAGKVLANFTLLGQTVAKALQDNRLMDIPLSHTFYRTALGQQLDLYNIREMDSGLGISLERFAAAHNAWVAGGRKQPLSIDGQPIEDLCLSFELPGYPGYELKPRGSEIDVTANNLHEYVEAVVEATLRSGIRAQLEAFRTGFSQVLPLDSLKCFYPDELEAVLCGQGETWTPELLLEAIKFDHGYTANSTAVKFFVEILSELDAADQRRFLRFITGSPRLRPGGLGALHPRLTVVRKHASSSMNDIQPGSSVELLARSGSIVDGDLPSVMTCANYIKLPPYSSKRIMQARILYAIREGQGSFDLS